MFWLGFALAAVTLAVWGIVAYILLMGWQVPVILQAPRPHFMVLLFSVPAIAQASASGSLLLVAGPADRQAFGAWPISKLHGRSIAQRNYPGGVEEVDPWYASVPHCNEHLWLVQSSFLETAKLLPLEWSWSSSSLP